MKCGDARTVRKADGYGDVKKQRFEKLWNILHDAQAPAKTLWRNCTSTTFSKNGGGPARTKITEQVMKRVRQAGAR